MQTAREFFATLRIRKAHDLNPDRSAGAEVSLLLGSYLCVNLPCDEKSSASILAMSVRPGTIGRRRR